LRFYYYTHIALPDNSRYKDLVTITRIWYWVFKTILTACAWPLLQLHGIGVV